MTIITNEEIQMRRISAFSEEQLYRPIVHGNDYHEEEYVSEEEIDALTLEDLANTDVVDPEENQILVFDGTNWVNADFLDDAKCKVFTAEADQINFDITDIYNEDYLSIIVYKNSVKQTEDTDYTLDVDDDPRLIVFTSGCTAGDIIIVVLSTAHLLS